jgi:hypothetical protein
MSKNGKGKAPRHGNVWGSGGVARRILTSVVDGGEWSASRPGRFILGERAPRYRFDRLSGPQEP